MRLYIIGPVTGIDFDNRPEFTRAKFRLEGAGYEPSIPHDFVPQYADWETAMKVSIAHLLEADGVALLDGWQDSRGARLEYDIARRLSIPAYDVAWWMKHAAHYANGREAID